jgi:hypothetical protein
LAAFSLCVFVGQQAPGKVGPPTLRVESCRWHEPRNSQRQSRLTISDGLLSSHSDAALTSVLKECFQQFGVGGSALSSRWAT